MPLVPTSGMKPYKIKGAIMPHTVQYIVTVFSDWHECNKPVIARASFVLSSGRTPPLSHTIGIRDYVVYNIDGHTRVLARSKIKAGWWFFRSKHICVFLHFS